MDLKAIRELKAHGDKVSVDLPCGARMSIERSIIGKDKGYEVVINDRLAFASVPFHGQMPDDLEYKSVKIFVLDKSLPVLSKIISALSKVVKP